MSKRNLLWSILANLVSSAAYEFFAETFVTFVRQSILELLIRTALRNGKRPIALSSEGD